MKVLRTKNVHIIGFRKCKLIVIPIAMPSLNGWTITLSLQQEIGSGIEKQYAPLHINKPMNREFTYQQIEDIQTSLNLSNVDSFYEGVEMLNVKGTMMIIDDEKLFDTLVSSDFEIIEHAVQV